MFGISYFGLRAGCQARRLAASLSAVDRQRGAVLVETSLGDGDAADLVLGEPLARPEFQQLDDDLVAVLALDGVEAADQLRFREPAGQVAGGGLGPKQRPRG